jgi:hypothetical protein
MPASPIMLRFWWRKALLHIRFDGVAGGNALIRQLSLELMRDDGERASHLSENILRFRHPYARTPQVFKSSGKLRSNHQKISAKVRTQGDPIRMSAVEGVEDPGIRLFTALGCLS